MINQDKKIVDGTNIELYDQAPWSRTTVADGKWLQQNTLDPISANDRILASAIHDVSATLQDEIDYLGDELYNTSSYLNEEITKINARADVIDVVGNHEAFEERSAHLVPGVDISDRDVIKVLNDVGDDIPAWVLDNGSYVLSSIDTNNQQSYYRWLSAVDGNTSGWEYVGSLEPYYKDIELSENNITFENTAPERNYSIKADTNRYIQITPYNHDASIGLSDDFINSANLAFEAYDALSSISGINDGSITGPRVNHLVSNFSLAQGSANSATYYSFSQGLNNSAENDSLAQGANNKANNRGQALGYANSAESDSFAAGYECSADLQSFAQGKDVYAITASIAQGIENNANNYSFTQGSANSASYDSFAQGKRNYAYGQSIAAGVDNYAKNQSQALGSTNSATTDGFAAGSNNSATLAASFAQGTTNYAYNSSFAQGTSNSALTQSFAQGRNNSANYDAFAQGLSAFANYESLAQGLEVTAESKSFAQGSKNKARNNSVAIGNSNSADNQSFAVGTNNIGSSEGFSHGVSNESNADSLAQGQGNSATNRSLAQGLNNYANYYSLAQGQNNKAKTYSLAQGDSNSATSYAAAFGLNNDASETSITQGNANTASYQSIAIGNTNSAYLGSVAIGSTNVASTYSQAFGNKTSAISYSIAIGKENYVSGNGSIAGGVSSNISGNGTLVIGETNTVSADASIIAGKNNTVNEKDNSVSYFVLGSNNSAVPLANNWSYGNRTNIIAGYNNKLSGLNSVLLFGRNHTVSSDDDNHGFAYIRDSLIVGEQNTLKGQLENVTVLGQRNAFNATGAGDYDYARDTLIAGYSNTVNGSYKGSILLGGENNVNIENNLHGNTLGNVILGEQNKFTLNSDTHGLLGAIIAGLGNNVSGSTVSVIGQSNDAYAAYSNIFGYGNKVINSNGYVYDVAVGNSNIISGNMDYQNSFAFGDSNRIYDIKDSMVVGFDLSGEASALKLGYADKYVIIPKNGEVSGIDFVETTNGNRLSQIMSKSAKFSAYNDSTKIAEFPISGFKLQANTAKYISATSAANTMIFNVSDALINSASSGAAASAYIANSGVGTRVCGEDFHGLYQYGYVLIDSNNAIYSFPEPGETRTMLGYIVPIPGNTDENKLLRVEQSVPTWSNFDAISNVNHDDTLTGDGTSTAALGVVNNLKFSNVMGGSDLSRASATITHERINNPTMEYMKLQLKNENGNTGNYTLIPTNITSGYLYANGLGPITTRSINSSQIWCYAFTTANNSLTTTKSADYLEIHLTTPYDYNGPETYTATIDNQVFRLYSGAYCKLIYQWVESHNKWCVADSGYYDI